MNCSVFKKILVAVDGSESAKKAVDTAVGIAKNCENMLYAVHVISMEFLYETLPIDEELEETFQEKLMTRGKQATAYVENAGKQQTLKLNP